MPPPNNPFRDAVAAVNPFRDAPAKEGKGAGKSPATANYVAREIAARRVLDNIMSTPSAGGELLSTVMSAGLAATETAARAGANNARRLVGAPRVEGPTFGERFAAHQEQPNIAQGALKSIPRPSVETVTAGIESAPALVPGGESPSDAMLRNRLEFRAQDAKMEREHPTAAQVGEIGGDVASLFIGRKGTGASKLMQRVETRLAGKVGEAAERTLTTDLEKIFKGPAQRMARGGARAAETGIEAAALDLLKDPNADPTETAAMAAGSQLAGSAALSAATGLLTGSKPLWVAAVSTAGLLQVLKSVAPGGRDRVLESIESGFDHVAHGFMLGAASGAIGATRYGRGNAALAERSRVLLDGIATVHRGTVLSVLTDYAHGDETTQSAIERVLTGLSEDPKGFKPADDAERAIVRRLNDGTQLGAKKP